MILAHEDFTYIDKALEYITNHHVKGIPRKEEVSVRAHAAELRKTIKRNEFELDVDDHLTLVFALSAYADSLANNVLYTDYATIDHLYSLAELFDTAFDEDIDSILSEPNSETDG